MPLSEFDHPEKGDALYGQFSYLFVIKCVICFNLFILEHVVLDMKLLLVGPLHEFLEAACGLCHCQF